MNAGVDPTLCRENCGLHGFTIVFTAYVWNINMKDITHFNQKQYWKYDRMHFVTHVGILTFKFYAQQK